MAASLTKPFVGAPHTSTGSLHSPSLLPSRNIIQLPSRRSQLKRLGLTTGSPIKVYSETSEACRPSRARGLRLKKGGWRSFDRETTVEVPDGLLSMYFLQNFGRTDILAYVSQIHKVVLPETLVDHETLTYDQIKGSTIRCPNPEYEEKMIAAIEAVRVRGDIGGTVTCIVRNFSRNHGFRAFQEIASALGKGVMSLPKTVSFEIGTGFTGTFMTGNQYIDKFGQFGGIQGGISHPETIKMRIAFKPIVSISMRTKMEPTDRGDLDFCAVNRAVDFVEAMVAQVLLPISYQTIKEDIPKKIK